MKTISLTRGKFALVDDEDHERLSKFKWHPCTRYAQRYVMIRAGKSIRMLMHRELLGLEAGDPRHVDHVDGNGLNNQKSNLRFATRAQNAMNSKTYRSNNSGFRGVSFYKRAGKFQAHIQTNCRHKGLGLFDTAEEAARTYDSAAVRLHGEFARLNFPQIQNETAITTT
jgi:AP2 domain/HNH endonuclease